LTIFAIPSKITNLSPDLTAKAASLPAGWSAATTSCIAEGKNGRALTGAATASADMTPSKCAAFCASQGFKFAGVEYSNECHCGNDLSNGASLSVPSSQCNMGCSGDSNIICGGYGALSLYTNPSIVPPVSSSNVPTVSGSLPAGWTAASTQCIKEVSGRALTGASIAGSSMTISTCLSFCQSRGFQLAGLEFGCKPLCFAFTLADRFSRVLLCRHPYQWSLTVYLVKPVQHALCQRPHLVVWWSQRYSALFEPFTRLCCSSACRRSCAYRDQWLH
jgi:hypothetical protein